MLQESSFHLNAQCAAIQELQTYAHWVCYRKEERHGRLTKVPYAPSSGRCAQSNDPATWSDYQTAERAVQTYHCDGLGYMFHQDFTGVDLDHCVATSGEIEPWALKIIRFLDSYTEFSPSGSGVHILVRGHIPKGIRRFVPPDKHPQQEHAAVEMYCEKRYFTITGEHVPGTPEEIMSRQAQLDKLFRRVTLDAEAGSPSHNKIIALPLGPKPRPSSSGNPHPSATSEPQPVSSQNSTSRAIVPYIATSPASDDGTSQLASRDLSDDLLLQRACAASNGERFRTLYYQREGHNYPSPSEADMALCLHLAFWTGCDVNRMDALFRQSVLFREKWDSVRHDTTYGRETLQRAIEHCPEVYKPSQRPDIRSEIDEHFEQLLAATNHDDLIEGECLLEFQHANESTKWLCQPRKVSLHEILSCLQERELGDAQLFNEAFEHLAWFDFLQNDWYLWRDHTWQRDQAGKSILLVATVASYYSRAANLLTGRQETLLAQIEQIKRACQFVGQDQIDTLTNSAQTLFEQIKKLRKRSEDLHVYARMKNVLLLAQPLMTIRSQDWDQQPFLLPTPNGVIDLKTGDCADGHPDDYMRVSCPTTWTGLDTPCPRWERFLQEIFADKPEHNEIISFLQRLLGYGITGSTQDHIFSIFYGPQGYNGKDTLFSIFHHVMGDLANVVPNDIFLASDYTRSTGSATPHLERLHGMRSAWGSEPNLGDRLDVGQVKQLTGGGDIITRSVYGKTYYSFSPTHKLFMMTNHKLTINASEEAAWERFCLLDFGMRFLDDPDPCKPNEQPRDPQLIETLKQESSGILAWLVRGCLDWQKQGLAIPPVLKKLTRDYRDEEDIIKCFIDDSCHADPDAIIKATVLYSAYKQWHLDNQHGRCMTNNMFGREMAKRFERVHTYTGNAYRGIELGHSYQSTRLAEALDEFDAAEKLDEFDTAEGYEGLKDFSTSFQNKIEEENKKNNNKFVENPINPSYPSYPSAEPPIEIEQTTLDDFLSPDCAIPPEDGYPYDDCDVPPEESCSLEAVLELEKQIQCANCRAQWHQVVANNDLAQAHYGCWWCDQCTDRYDLMQLAHKKDYPALSLSHIDIQAGCTSWLIVARTRPEKYIKYIMKHLIT